jgi:hypothetical protein
MPTWPDASFRCSPTMSGVGALGPLLVRGQLATEYEGIKQHRKYSDR